MFVVFYLFLGAAIVAVFTYVTLTLVLGYSAVAVMII